MRPVHNCLRKPVLSVLLRLRLPEMLTWLIRRALTIQWHLTVRDLDLLSSCRRWWRGGLLGVLPLSDLRCAGTGLVGLQAQRRAEHWVCSGSLPGVSLNFFLVGLGRAQALLGSIGLLRSSCLQSRVRHLIRGGCLRGRVLVGPSIRDGGVVVQVLLAVQAVLEGAWGRLCMLGPRRHRGIGVRARVLLSWLAPVRLRVLGCRGLCMACWSCQGC